MSTIKKTLKTRRVGPRRAKKTERVPAGKAKAAVLSKQKKKKRQTRR